MKNTERCGAKGSSPLDPVKWERLMTAALLALTVALGWCPADRTVWYVEMVCVVGLWAILFFTRRIFLFSTAAYFCFFIWMVLQVVGAHYTFECVPMDWLTKPLGLVRNPYDRIAHFAVGWFAFPLAELFHRRGWTRSPGFTAFFAVALTVALAGIWELVEWLYAVLDGGAAGAAFLGSQGDEWNAQKDIFCDTLGALCAAGAFLCRISRSPRYWMRTTQTSVRTKEHILEMILGVLLVVVECSILFSGVFSAAVALLHDGLFSRWWVGVLIAFAAYKVGEGTWPTKGFLRLFLGTFGWFIILSGFCFAVQVLCRDGLLSRWWVGFLFVVTGYKLAGSMGMVRKTTVGLKWWWTFESGAKKKRSGARTEPR